MILQILCISSLVPLASCSFKWISRFSLAERVLPLSPSEATGKKSPRNIFWLYGSTMQLAKISAASSRTCLADELLYRSKPWSICTPREEKTHSE